MNMQVMSIPLKKHINMRVSAKNKEVPQVTMVLNLHVTKITHPNWFRSRGGGSYIFSNVWKSGGVNPSLFAKNIWELWGKCILCNGIEPENACFLGVQLTRANGYINFCKFMEAWWFCTSIQLISFSWETFWNPWKPEDHPGNTWGPLNTNTHHSQDMTPTHKTIAVVFSWGAVPDPLGLDR